MSYNFVNQSIVSSLLINVKDDDPFFNPILLALSGFSANGFYYDSGVKTSATASWYSEPQGEFRGPLQTFPQSALVLLSYAALTILDVSNAVQTSSMLPLWMQFILSDDYALTDNFDPNALIGYTPAGLSYGGGVIAVNYTPDAGASPQGGMAVNLDFTLDSVYLYAVATP